MRREKFKAFSTAVAKNYSVENVAEKFSVTEPMSTKLFDAIQASSAFLKKVTFINSIDQKGQAISMSIPSTVTSRTDTSGAGRRIGKGIGAMVGSTYSCEKTNADVKMPYSKLDVWARYADFNSRWGNAVNQRRALDILLIATNGTSCATNTNDTTNPLLQDVNKGWLQIMRDEKPENVINDGAEKTGKVIVSKGKDFENLDALVYSALSLIPKHLLTGNEQAIISKDLIDARNIKLIDATTAPDQVNALSKMAVNVIGTLAIDTIAGMPNGTVIVCDPAKLQYYYQGSSLRKALIDKPDEDAITDYQSVNSGFGIEMLDAVVIVENVEVI